MHWSNNYTTMHFIDNANGSNEMKAELEQKLTAVAGRPVEIAIRGDRSFTLSFEAIDQAATDRIAAFFAPADVEVETDAELDMTFVYLEV